MRVHLINPSHVSFGVAVITPRWLYVLAAATPPMWGDPAIVDETLEPIDPRPFRLAMWLALDCTQATRSGATRSDKRRALAVHGSFLEAFTPPSFRMRLTRLVAPTLLFEEMATWFGHASSRTVQMAGRNVFTREAVFRVIDSCPLAGTSCRVNGTCGPRCRPCAAVPSIVLFVLCGAQMGRNLVSAVLTPSSGKWWSCAVWDFVLLRWPTTISIP